MSGFRVELATSHPVIFLTGEITGESKENLTSAWKQAASGKKDLVVLDFSGVQYINSSGIALLIDLSKERHKGGPGIVIAALPQKVKKVLEMVGLLNYIETYESTEAALAETTL